MQQTLTRGANTPRHSASDTLAVEQMFAPTVFGIEDVLRRHAHWEIGARAHTTCLVATLPLELWKRLAMHSTAPYKRVTRKTMLMFKADRSVWYVPHAVAPNPTAVCNAQCATYPRHNRYEVRTEGDADTLAIAYDFMLSVQVAWISCSACGLKGHTSDLCPRRRRGSANSRVLPPGQRGLVVNNRLKFQKGSSVSTQLYQMGQALMRRTMEEAAKAGEDWNLALKVKHYQPRAHLCSVFAAHILPALHCTASTVACSRRSAASAGLIELLPES